MKRFWRIGLVLVAVLAFAGAAVGFVAAQTDGEGQVEAASRQFGENFVAQLAENLGISQEELEAAITQTKLDMVDQALADGRITEEQAERLRERIESGEGPLFPKPPHRPPQRMFHIVRQVAEFLGVEPGAVVEGLKDGQSLAQIAEANGSSAEELSAFLLGKLEARLAEAVANGRITQERADEILANAAEHIERLINHEGLPGKPPQDAPAGAPFPGRVAPEGDVPGMPPVP